MPGAEPSGGIFQTRSREVGSPERTCNAVIKIVARSPEDQ